MRVEFRVLGPIEALVDGEPVALGGRRQRAVLALLLARANETVPAERLIDGVWGEEPPETAANLVQGYVSQLRKSLGKQTIATRGRGYAVAVPSGALDLHSFERRFSEGVAQRDSGSTAEAAVSFAEALAIWRGPALTDLTDLPEVAGIAARLDDLRLAATERRIECDLDRGKEAECAAELDLLIAEHPLRERLRALQMLALYRAGRQAEALEAYARARATLVEELGIEPGAELVEMQAAILKQDAALAAPAGDAGRSGDRSRTRAVLAVPLSSEALPGLAEIGGALAGRPGHELVLCSTVTRSEQLAPMTAGLREAGSRLSDLGVAVRSGAFTSVAPGSDISRLAAEQDVDLVIVDAPEGLLEDARLMTLLEDAPCDVAVAVGEPALGEGHVLVPFSGVEHDWAAVELGAWLSLSLGRPLRLAGPSTGPSGRDASRLLASASLALQRALGADADPVIVEPSTEALLAEAGDAGVVVLGLPERWRREGLGRVRTALATSGGITTLLVRRGLRPGGLAPPGGQTRFTWTIAGPGR